MLTPRDARRLRALKERRNRAASGQFVAEGIRVVEDLLRSPLVVRSILAASSLVDSPRGAGLMELIDERGIPSVTVSDREFDEFASTESPQGVLAVAEIPVWSFDHLPRARSSAVVLVLDGIQDPGNLGTMIRTAEAIGAVGIVTLPGTVETWNPKVVRSAAGSAFRLPILSANWPETRDQLRSRGYSLLGASMEGDPLGSPPEEGAALVMGNEGAGITPDVRRDLDRIVGIPLRGRAESLNVAAAAAILLYELLR